MHAKVPADRGSGANAPRSPTQSVSTVPPGTRAPRKARGYSREPMRIRRGGHDGELRAADTAPAAPGAGPAIAKDHFISRDGEEFAGTHLILDLWGAERLGDLDFIEHAMRRAVEVAGATLLHIHLHHFGSGSGVSGVAVLAESHISVHTWPERDFAAFDVFMCGSAEPLKAIDVLRQAFRPVRSDLLEARRGVV
jgi:S-adenosylmethionine decarboxylase